MFNGAGPGADVLEEEGGRFSEPAEYADYSGPDMEAFEAEGRAILGMGAGADNERRLAYSKVLAEWVHVPPRAALSFLRKGALQKDQLIVPDRLVHWFDFEFNAWACNRFGIITIVEGRIKTLTDQAEDAQTGEDIVEALDLAHQRDLAQKERKRLERAGTRGKSADTVDHMRQEWEEAQQLILNADVRALSLQPAAQACYSHQLYLDFTRDSIARDRARGMDVDGYDWTAVKAELAAGKDVIELGHRMPRSWRAIYGQYEVNQATGHEYRNSGLVAITWGNGYMPPEPTDEKGWRRFLRRRPNVGRPGQRGRRPQSQPDQDYGE